MKARMLSEVCGGAPPPASGWRCVERWRARRDSFFPESLLALDWLCAVAVWLTFGTLFFYCSAPPTRRDVFTLAYSFYFTVNLGFGIGSAPFQTDETITELYTIFHCLTGNVLVVGGVGTYFRLIVATKARRSRTGQCANPYGLSNFTWFMMASFAFVWIGFAVGHWGAGYDSFADLLVFSVTNLTTAGLLVGETRWENWVSQGIFFLLGIPVTGLFFAELAALYFDVQEQSELQRRAVTQSMRIVTTLVLEHEDSHGSVRLVSARRLEYLEELARTCGFVEAAPEQPTAVCCSRVVDEDSATTSPFRGEWSERTNAVLAEDFPTLMDLTLTRSWIELRTVGDPALLLFVDLALALGAWLLVGAFSFRALEQGTNAGWNLSYSLYYSVNIGCGVGNAVKKVEAGDTPALVFEAFYCVAGHAIIVSGIGLLFRVTALRFRARRSLRADAHILFIVWSWFGTVLVAGLAVAKYSCGFERPMDLLLWSATNMTSAGLRSIRKHHAHFHAYAFTTAFFLVGIPAALVASSELSSVLFDEHERNVVLRRRDLATIAHDRDQDTATERRRSPENAAKCLNAARPTPVICAVKANYLRYLLSLDTKYGRDLEETQDDDERQAIQAILQSEAQPDD